MTATPLQLAAATAALATRGKRFKPHLVTAIENPLTGERTSIAAESLPDVDIQNEFYWVSVIGAMHDVLQGKRGTARAVGTGAPYEMAGKSGTAQVFTVGQDESFEQEDLTERLRDHALFIAFAPLDNPQIAVAVIVENGSSGSSVAAPMARAIMDRHLGVEIDAL
jgi:penicillin-binding protein 2